MLSRSEKKMKKAFSNELYVELQSKHIQERIEQFPSLEVITIFFRTSF